MPQSPGLALPRGQHAALAPPPALVPLRALPQLALDRLARGPSGRHCSSCSRTRPSPSSSQRRSQCRAQEQFRRFPDSTLRRGHGGRAGPAPGRGAGGGRGQTAAWASRGEGAGM